MAERYTFLRLIPLFALFVIPNLLHGSGDPTGNPPNGGQISPDSIANALALGHCNPVTVEVIDCATKTIRLSAYVRFLFSGQLVPYVALWNTGDSAHQITVVPPGA